MPGKAVSRKLAESFCCVSGCKINSKTHPNTVFHVLNIENITLYNLPNYNLKRELKICNDHYFSSELLNLNHDHFASDSPQNHTPSIGEVSSNFDLYLNYHNSIPAQPNPEVVSAMPDMPSLDDTTAIPSQTETEICRVCLCDGNLKNINTDRINNILIKEMLERFYFVNIPNFPQKICEKCLKELWMCFAFFQKLENSTLHLINMNQSSVICNLKNDIDQNSDNSPFKFDTKDNPAALKKQNGIESKENEFSQKIDESQNSDISLKSEKKIPENDLNLLDNDKSKKSKNKPKTNNLKKKKKCLASKDNQFTQKPENEISKIDSYISERKKPKNDTIAVKSKKQKIVLNSLDNENNNINKVSDEPTDVSLKLNSKKSEDLDLADIEKNKKLVVVLEKLTPTNIKKIIKDLKKQSELNKKRTVTKKQLKVPETNRNNNNELITQLKTELEVILKDLNPSLAKVEIKNAIKMKETCEIIKRKRGRPTSLANLQKNRVLTITSHDIKDIFEKALENNQITPDDISSTPTSGENKLILESSAYPCHKCNKLFLKKEVLDLHLCSSEIKVGFLLMEKSHKCQKCSRTFKNIYQILKHSCLAVTCDICSRVFRNNNVLEDHKEQKHGILNSTPKFSCETCGRKYRQKCTLTAHIKLKHLHTSERKPQMRNCKKYVNGNV